MKTGLVSVSFRNLSPDSIIRLTEKAKLDGIEWGGDIHVPHGNIDIAKAIGKRTRNAGLFVACYGSYWRAAGRQPGNPDMIAVIDSALALGAPLIRVWAGEQGSDIANAEYIDCVVHALRKFTQQANAAGLHVALEYHRNTLADNRESAKSLLDKIPALSTLWQPPVGALHESNQLDLETLSPRLKNLHVYSWQSNPDHTFSRLPLSAYQEHWKNYFHLAKAPDRFALLEFVKEDSESQFLQDASVLRKLIAG